MGDSLFNCKMSFIFKFAVNYLAIFCRVPVKHFTQEKTPFDSNIVHKQSEWFKHTGVFNRNQTKPQNFTSEKLRSFIQHIRLLGSHFQDGSEIGWFLLFWQSFRTRNVATLSDSTDKSDNFSWAKLAFYAVHPIVPHIIVWGSYFWLCTSAGLPRPPPPAFSLAPLTSHTAYPPTTHSHTTYPHTTYSHTQLTHTQLTHTQLTQTQVTHTQLTHTQQAWHLVTSTVTLRGRRGTYGTGLVLVSRLGPGGRRGRRGTLRGRRGTWWHGPSLCVASVALGDSDLHFAWQAWHLMTSTFTLRGRCGTYGTGLVTRLVAVALGDIDRHFAWQAWHLWWHRPSLCVAGVALMALGWFCWRAWVPVGAVFAAWQEALGDSDLRFAWQA